MRSSRSSAAERLPNERLFHQPNELSLETVRAASQGDAAAFARIVRFYYPRCLRFARRFLTSLEDAEECVQDTFVRVHRALPRYDERQRFNAWLFRILANRCKSAQGRARLQVTTPAAQLDVARDLRAGHESFLARDELLRALKRLPSEQREAFLLRHIEGLEYNQISTITAVSVTAARMRVSRACTALRKAVTQSDA